MAYTYLTTEAEIRNRLNWAQNIDLNWWKANRRIAQDLYIKAVLCNSVTHDALYNQLVDQVANNTVTPENETLLDQIAQPYALRVAQLSWDEIANKLTPAGTASMTMPLGMAPPTSQNNKQVLRYEQLAAIYESQVRQFLNDHLDDYPLWQHRQNEATPNSVNPFYISRRNQINPGCLDC